MRDPKMGQLPISAPGDFITDSPTTARFSCGMRPLTLRLAE